MKQFTEDKMRILIVEDDFASRIVLQKFLAPFGQCDITINGLEAVQAFQLALDEGNPYNLICLDIMMPEMNGQEALKEIRKIEETRDIFSKDQVKIIMMTALDTPKDVIEAYYKGGCSSYLVKPIIRKKIISLLKEYNLIEA